MGKEVESDMPYEPEHYEVEITLERIAKATHNKLYENCISQGYEIWWETNSLLLATFYETTLEEIKLKPIVDDCVNKIDDPEWAGARHLNMEED